MWLCAVQEARDFSRIAWSYQQRVPIFRYKRTHAKRNDWLTAEITVWDLCFKHRFFTCRRRSRVILNMLVRVSRLRNIFVSLIFIFACSKRRNKRKCSLPRRLISGLITALARRRKVVNLARECERISHRRMSLLYPFARVATRSSCIRARWWWVFNATELCHTEIKIIRYRAICVKFLGTAPTRYNAGCALATSSSCAIVKPLRH